MRTTMLGFTRCFGLRLLKAGPRASRRAFLHLGAVALIGLIAGVTPKAAYAQSPVDNPNGVFQLEGDATTDLYVCFLPPGSGGPAFADPVAPGGSAPTCPSGYALVTYASSTDDWDLIFSGKSHSMTTAFISDPANTRNDDAFLGTSSSLSQNISQWTWQSHSSQGKADIEHAMFAAYPLGMGHTGLFMGMDRFDNSGDTTAGFFLAQDPTFDLCTGVGKGAGGQNDANCTAAGTFVGSSTVGDLLVLSDFSTGGAVSTINVYTWNGSTYVLDESRSPAPCDPSTGTSALCGLVNNQFGLTTDHKGNTVLTAVNTTAPWQFTNKANQSTFATGEFLEVGIDLQSVFGSDIPCFTKAMALTASSTSLNASLSDLTAPVNFPLCGASVTKSCTGASILADGKTIEYDFDGMVKNTGIAALSKTCVTDTLPTGVGASNLSLTQPDACTSGTVNSGATAPLPSSCPAGDAGNSYCGSFDTTSILSTNQNEVTLNAQTSGGTGISPAHGYWLSGTASLSCSPTITGTLALTKNCTGVAINKSTLAITVSYSGTVTNNANVAVSNLAVKDTPDGGSETSVDCKDAGGNTVTSLAPGASCTYSGSYTATKCETSTDGGVCLFEDTANASADGALGAGTLTAVPASGMCHLCPAGACAATTP